MKMNTQFKLVAILVLFSFMALGQNERFALYTFDDCATTNQGNFGTEAIFLSNVSCDCGVIENGIRLDGNQARIQLPDTIRELFRGNFTVSFYVSVENTMDLIDLFSYRTSCNKDSSFSVNYTPQTNILRVEFAEDFNNILELRGSLDKKACWNHIAITRFNLEYALYVNGVLMQRLETRRQTPFGRNAKLFISNSPCLAFTETRLRGRIDEFEVIDRALGPLELRGEFLHPERILNNDTTIFIGESVHLRLGPTCSDIVQWSPHDGLSNPNIPDPIASPVQTTLYKVNIDNGSCTSRDSVRIFTISRDDLQCDDLMLPRAFTPNNDGLNDVFYISNRFLVDDLVSFEILDRTGERLFITNSVHEGWDGSFKGKAVNPGVYFYKIVYTCGSREYIKVNNFTVLR